jgi:outer membrane protein OmpA-like peptidoglycan-associated protein
LKLASQEPEMSGGYHRIRVRRRIRTPQTSRTGTHDIQAIGRLNSETSTNRSGEDVRIGAADHEMAGSAFIGRNKAATAAYLLGLQKRYGNRYVTRIIDHFHISDETRNNVATNGAMSRNLDRQPQASVPGKQSFDGGFIKLVPTVERFDAAGKSLGSGSVKINDSSQNVSLGNVTNGDHGFIRFVIDASWDFGNRGQGHPLSIIIPTKGRARLVTLTPFRVPTTVGKEDDKIKFSTTRPTLQFTEGKGASLDKQPTASGDPDDLGGSVTISPSITFQVQTAAQTQGTVNVDLVIVDGSVSEAFQSAVNEVESIGRAYTANLKYQEPKPTPPTTASKLFQQEVFFAVGSDKVSDPEYTKLRSWFEGKLPGVGSGSDPIPPEANGSVMSGNSEVNLFGQASNTGSPAYNQALSRRRAQHVRDIMQDFASSHAKFNIVALGPVESGPTTEDAGVRRVVIWFKADVAATPPGPTEASGETTVP